MSYKWQLNFACKKLDALAIMKKNSRMFYFATNKIFVIM